MAAWYDTIGVNYADLRKPDPRIAQAMDDALGSAENVLNVGAGAGSYEPVGRRVTAVEPSMEMIRQRSPSLAVAVQGYAEDLPFGDDSFDASMAVLTIHHWADKSKGLCEMRRVTKGPVILLTFDPAHRGCWLTDYIPELVALDEGQMPSMADYADWLGAIEIVPVFIPHDCTDGFLYAYWRRPGAYLDPRIRTGMSSFWAIENVEKGLEKLQRDLESGEWEQRYSNLLQQDSIDAGYRLVIAR
ncbi:class I SAM-dependent methyltransferase [Parasphingopyxis lamellibrachiae]|uniref:Methyltransferase family protein n=1 Tax=Parasphingopyxis lamellibrachiae TaxID=680125 RepID=A0A3D9FCA6_9SPHN|nr:class I SAM-dependent methyltransferase [Parasphingopyxis lamellibrachiae]RED15415.1 methyltransferase family protein [Parasphingopyxis lamellibrachiae]